MTFVWEWEPLLLVAVRISYQYLQLSRVLPLSLLYSTVFIYLLVHEIIFVDDKNNNNDDDNDCHHRTNTQ